MKQSIARRKLEALLRLAMAHKKIRDRKSGEKVAKIAAIRLPKSDSPDERSLAGSVLSQAAS
jgi:DNA replicative helicase MCM subunit Mcm2 (Cdc46/Mcm family)